MKAKKTYTKITLAISILLITILLICGAGTSLAWFSDTTNDIQNNFIFGELDMVLSHKKEDGIYKEVVENTPVFDDKAIYEPGYVQVVYLRVENRGDVPFDYLLAVNVTEANIAKSILGNKIYLPDYLKYGVIFGDNEAVLERETAKILSKNKFPEENLNLPLNTYSEKDSVILNPGDMRYIAIIVRMPEEINNIANFRGSTIPTVKLGITATATQIIK